MSVEIKYMLKIQMQEIFKNIKIYVSMYALIILLSGVLYAQGFSMKITSNLVILMWISLMTFLGVKVFSGGERGSLFVITQRPIFLKYVRLISVQILFNLPLFACIYMQLFFIRQDFLKSLSLSLLSYLFAVMLGLFLGNTASKKSGFVILLLVFIYNFFVLNPYRQTEYSYFFGINEYLFNLRHLNSVNLSKMLFVILLGIFTVYLKRKHLHLQNSRLISYTLLMAALFVLEGVQYGSYIEGENAAPQINIIGDREVSFKNINPSEYMKGVALLEQIQNDYVSLGGSAVRSYAAEKSFLSSLQWKFVPQAKKYVLEANSLKINIYSLSALNFDEPELVSKNCDDMLVIWKSSIPDYIDGNRYFRHIIDGSGETFKVHALNAVFGENSTASNFVKKELEAIFESAITKNNYVKRVGMLVADRHEQQLTELAKVLDETKVKTDKDFIQILKDSFPDIYRDPYIHDFFAEMLTE